MTEDDKRPHEDQDIAENAAGETAANAEAAENAEDQSAAENEGTAEKASPDAELTPEEEIAQLKDRLLRSLAENENLIRRGRREREDAMKYAAANFARDMLSVADNLARALEVAPDPAEAGEDSTLAAFIEGVELTGRELASALERHKIVKISPLGEKFDHDRHEALFEVPTSDVAPGTVVQVVEDGYMIHDRLLRAARVGVAKALDSDGSEGDEHTVDRTV